MTTRFTRRKEEESEQNQDGASTTARSLHRARRTANKIPTVWITRSQCQVYIFTVLFFFFKSVELQITPGNERKADAKTFAPSLADQPSVAFRPQLYPYCTSTTIENRVPTASWNPLCHIAPLPMSISHSKERRNTNCRTAGGRPEVPLDRSIAQELIGKTESKHRQHPAAAYLPKTNQSPSRKNSARLYLPYPVCIVCGGIRRE